MGINFPTSPTVGQLYPATSTPGLPQYIWDGEKWKASAIPGAVTVNRYLYSATAGQTVFSGADVSGAVLSYTPGLEIVCVNGFTIPKSEYTTNAAGTQITLASASVSADAVDIYAPTSFTTVTRDKVYAAPFDAMMYN